MIMRTFMSSGAIESFENRSAHADRPSELQGMHEMSNATRARAHAKSSRRGRVSVRNEVIVLSSMVMSSIVALWPSRTDAQTAPLEAPVYLSRDPNGVDVLSGSPFVQLSDVQIGASGSVMEHSIHGGNIIIAGGGNISNGPFDNYFGYFYTDSNGYCGSNFQGATTTGIAFGGSAELFYASGSAYLPCNQGSSTWVSSGGGTFIYTKGDGTTINFWGNPVVKYPDGRALSISQKTVTVTPWDSYYASRTLTRIQSVTRNDGLQLKYNYALNTTPTYQNYASWSMPVSITAINNAFDYCDPAADTCTLTYSWPTATYAYTSGSTSTFTVTDAQSRVTRYTMDIYSRIAGVKLPSSASADSLTYNYCNSACYRTDGVTTTYFNNMIHSVIRDGQTWNYSYSPGGAYSFSSYSSSFGVGSPTDATGGTTAQTAPYFNSPVVGIGTVDGTSYRFDPMSFTGRVTRADKTEGNSISYSYDTRGNVTAVTNTPKSGSPLSPISSSANYDTACSNPFTCNKPHWVKDALSNETDYNYDPNHGGVLTVTAPPDANGIRPQTRFSYAQRYAWVKNAAGTYVQAATPIWIMTQKSICRKGSAATSGIGCALANDEVITAYEYGPNSGPNNLFLRGTSITADGQTLRTCYGYDERGNKISETLPRAGQTSCP